MSLPHEKKKKQRKTKNKKGKKEKHTTPGIRWSSPTQLLLWRSPGYLGQSGRDAEFSSAYGRMWWFWGGKGVCLLSGGC